MTTHMQAGDTPSVHTLVHLTWCENRIEHWIRFGRIAGEQRLDRHRRIVSFAPDSIFACVRWAGNAHGTITSRIDIVRAPAPGESCQTLAFVQPGGDILLRVAGWPKVETVLGAINAIEAQGIAAADVAPDHWRHIHTRVAVTEPFRTYTPEQHRAWLRRRGLRT
ncbi:DUF2840 domain-containing protein [Xanthobacter autotrophicus DSM 431]|uniref:DUF2840 domain-containing protein n=1 Tax=Xanthobacter nonsaccharivorans TaxID=3119912 RepID=UPI003728CBE6